MVPTPKALKNDHTKARLAPGEQRSFLEAAIEKTSVDAIARLISVCPRTVRDWRREKFLIPYNALLLIARTYNLPLPHIVQKETQFWYVTKGAHKGGLASYEKQGGQIGDPKVRKQKWHEWWEKKGKLYSNFPFHPLPFHKPRKSAALAEFMGTMMGDGGMTKWQFTITLHHINDLAYCKFVVSLIEKLFGIVPAVRHVVKNSVNIITVSRSQLIQHLHELGLPIGNKVKQNFDIPEWIKKNEKYMIACIRGLVDTDGSVFTHQYRVNGKKYGYKKLSFCSVSPPLRNTVQTFLRNHGFHVRVSRGVDLRIESKAGVAHYMKLIGSHNPKHLNRYLN